ncbi:MAG: hypothetical protein F4114_18085 [Rhodospirillaceae bacterium]|nr:hypothetical protein [Rhodospirillaceae bacterium]MYB13282.1 hypothetical protein [Rhodospirillaceae bacterium]MYI50979.1 hypothetical protein [Rhodospirillaceae bacterium]
MAYADPEAGRAADRERFRKRTAARVAQGLCPRCGERPPAPERSLCGPCNDKRNAASRARDARLRAEGKPRRDPVREREYERERSRREAEARRAAGLCTRCGRQPAALGRSSCEPCLEKRRAADRARYAAGKAAGLPYGGANADAKRRAGRAKSRRRQKARKDAGLCIRCGKRPPVEGGTTCTPCRQKRQAAEQRNYAARRAAGCCTRCGEPVFEGLSRCRPCALADDAGRSPERKNARSRQRYAERRARGLCTACGAPSQGASRCPTCAEKSYHGSGYFRGIPVWDPRWTVIELDTGKEHGPFDSAADVALCLAFEKLDRDRVEVLSDASPMASLTAWG